MVHCVGAASHSYRNIIVDANRADELLNTMLMIDLNHIRSTSIFFDDTSAIACDQFLQSIATTPQLLFQWTLKRLTRNGDAKALSKQAVQFRPMAASQTDWFVAFMGRLVFDWQICDQCQDWRLRNTHHLSLVLVLTADMPPDADFLRYVWTRDLIALHCRAGYECPAFRLSPERGLILSSTWPGITEIIRTQTCSTSASPACAS